jgi:hypothetical protein
MCQRDDNGVREDDITLAACVISVPRAAYQAHRKPSSGFLDGVVSEFSLLQSAWRSAFFLV